MLHICLRVMSRAAALVHSARTTAGLTVRSLAAGAGVSASTVSRIEAGTMDPTMGMLERLLDAAGHSMDIDLNSDMGVPIASLADAWRSSSRGDVIDWTRLRAFVDYLNLHPARIPVCTMNAPNPSGSPLLDNLLAGIAETQCDEAGFPRPRWTSNVSALETPWSLSTTPQLHALAVHTTPSALANRGITLSRSSLWRANGGSEPRSTPQRKRAASTSQRAGTRTR